jgi:hypothetical protein
MRPIPFDPIGQHNLFIEELCADWRETGIVTLEAKHTPRAQRILEISRQTSSRERK